MQCKKKKKLKTAKLLSSEKFRKQNFQNLEFLEASISIILITNQ